MIPIHKIIISVPSGASSVSGISSIVIVSSLRNQFCLGLYETLSPYTGTSSAWAWLLLYSFLSYLSFGQTFGETFEALRSKKES